MSETLAQPEVAKPISHELDFSVLENAPEIASPQLNPEEVKIPNGEVLKQFEDEILGSPLPPEIRQKVDELREAKNQESAAQSAELAQLIDEATSGLFSRWIEKGTLEPPTLVEGHEQDLLSALSEALEKYAQTSAGKKDAEIKQLRDLLAGGISDPIQTKAIAKELGVKQATLLSVLPGQREKSRASLLAAAEYRLNELAPPAWGYDDKPRVWQDEIRREHASAEYQAADTFGEANTDLEQALKIMRSNFDINHTRRSIDDLRVELPKLEAVVKASSEELTKLLPAQKEMLSMIARGAVTPEQIIDYLKTRDQRTGVNLRGLFRQVVTKQWVNCQKNLAEPSLVGLSLTEKEITGVNNNLDKIDRLTELYGVRPDFSTQLTRQEIPKKILASQQLFFEKLGSESELYWHFDAQGLKIIESGELHSGAKAGTAGRNTGEWSTGVHFTKPGTGMNSHDNYPGYATTTLNFGTKEKVKKALGIAVIFRLGDVIKQTPLRAEPIIDINRGRGNVSEDVTFRPADGRNEYSYNIDDAYIVPMATYEQLQRLKDDPRFTDIFEQPSSKPHLIARQILERSLKLAGRSDEWIAEHVVPYWEEFAKGEADDINNPYHDRKKVELDLQAAISRKIQSSSPPSRKIIAALSARKGLPEALGHIYGIDPQTWTEELITLEASASTNSATSA